MAGASAEGEVNHWPAFVDVLTTVIMVVTFLLVIMSAAVMVLSQRTLQVFKAQIEAKEGKDAGKDAKDGSKGLTPAQTVSAQIKAEAGTSTAELGGVLRSETPVNGSEQLTIRTRETPDTLKLQVKAVEESDDSKGVEVKTADVLLRVNFEPMAVRYNDEATKQVVDFLKTRQSPGMKYEIWSFAPQTSSISEAQRLAFYRAAMTRNLLVRAGIKPADIYTQIRISDGASKDGHNVRVVLKP